MERLFCFQKLKPGCTIEEYRQWSVECEQRVMPFAPGVLRFEVWRIDGCLLRDELERMVDDERLSRYDVAREVEIQSWEAWTDLIQHNDAVRGVAAGWDVFGDPASAMWWLRCEKVVA
jgi:hypothetical protein